MFKNLEVTVEEMKSIDKLLQTLSSLPAEMQKDVVLIANGFIEGYLHGYEKARAELSANQSATP